MATDDFGMFYKNVVQRIRREHRDWIRFDGEVMGSTRDIAGRFQHQDRIWIVHADTRFVPLEIAHKEFQAGRDPFQQKETRTGRGDCLELTKQLRKKQGPGPKYLYIYCWD